MIIDTTQYHIQHLTQLKLGICPLKRSRSLEQHIVRPNDNTRPRQTYWKPPTGVKIGHSNRHLDARQTRHLLQLLYSGIIDVAL